MARPLKDGVDYFPKDTGYYNDDKIKLIRAEFGAKGMYLLDYLLCDLYSKNGYYMKWDKNKCFLVSDGAGCGCSPDFVAEAVAGFIRCSVFDKRVFDDFGVLTSAGIQRRFMRMLTSRENFTFIQEYFLLDVTDKNDCPLGILKKCTFKKVSDIENPVIFKENPKKNTDNTQNKIKEIKINQSIINQNKEETPYNISYSFAQRDEDYQNRVDDKVKEIMDRYKKIKNDAKNDIDDFDETEDNENDKEENAIGRYLKENGLLNKGR